MSTDQEKNQIITHLMGSFKNKELYLINFIIFHFKYLTKWSELCNYVRSSLQKINDLQNLKIILQNLLNQLGLIELRLLKNNKIKIDNIFLTISQIKEISKNKRFTNFIIGLNLLNKTNFNLYSTDLNLIFNLPELKLNDILNIQEIAINNERNNLFLTDAKQKYSMLINNKKNLNKYIDNHDFLYWAFNYLNKKNPYFLIGTPINNNDYKEVINTTFDSIFIRNPLEYEKEVETLKKAWQQKQFRDKGKTKKEYHLPLTKQAKSELADLAKFKNLSENALLEELIHKTYLNEMCDENGKLRY